MDWREILRALRGKRNPKIKWEGRSVGKGRRGIQVLGRTATLEIGILPSVSNYTIR